MPDRSNKEGQPKGTNRTREEKFRYDLETLEVHDKPRLN